jgi:WD40 repeat protein
MPGSQISLKQVKELSRKEIVFGLARVPGSSRLVFGGSDFQVTQVDFAAEKPEAKAFAVGGHESYVTGVAVAGKRVISGGYDGNLIWWDLESGSKIRSVEAHAKWIRRVVATPDGATVASVADDMVARLWDAESGALKFELKGHKDVTPHHYPSMLHACAISSDGKFVATWSGRLRRASRSRRWRLPGFTRGILSSGGIRSAARGPWRSRPTATCWPPAGSA